jgi:hypothetical protein
VRLKVEGCGRGGSEVRVRAESLLGLECVYIVSRSWYRFRNLVYK